jgi:RNA polymerase sigma-70 factor, ECF subfamily
MPDPAPHVHAEEFVALLARHERLLGAYVMTMVPQPADADDILQEAKVVMWRAFAQFEPGTNFAAWARKVCFHQVLAFRKRRHRDRLDFSDAFIQAVAEEMDQASDTLAQRERALHSCLAKLSTDHRQVLELRYHENLELDDMATRLGRTTTALYRLLSRIRHSLHGCITESLATAHDV